MLSERELAALRSDLNSLLTETVQVQRASRAPDGYGGETATWTTVATVNGLRTTTGLRPAEQILAERLSTSSSWVMLLPALTDVRVDDRLVSNGRTFHVVAVLNGDLEFLRRVFVTEVV